MMNTVWKSSTHAHMICSHSQSVICFLPQIWAIHPSLHVQINHFIDLLQRNHQTKYFNLCNGTHNYCLLTIRSSWDSSDPQQWHIRERYPLHSLSVACVCFAFICVWERFVHVQIFPRLQLQTDNERLRCFVSESLLSASEGQRECLSCDTHRYSQKSICCWLNNQGQLRAENPSDAS